VRLLTSRPCFSQMERQQRVRHRSACSFPAALAQEQPH
jgi:hypothetical protein